MKVCAIIPAYNEEKTLSNLIHALKSQGIDVVVIDDGSTDSTREISITEGADVLTRRENQGKGFSLKEGFDHILNSDYEGVLTLDGDGQHDPEDLSNFLEEFDRSGADIIVGNRMSNTLSMPLLRRLTNKFMSFIISCACKVKIPDTQCGYRFITLKALKIIKLKTNDFEIETELLIQAARNNLTIASVPIKTIYRNEVSKIHPLKDTLRFFKYFVKEIWTSKH